MLSCCNAQMLPSELRSYIEHIPIDDIDSDTTDVIPLRTRRSTAESNVQTIGGVISIFAPGIKEEHRQAAKNCMLFADRAATQQVNSTDSFAWFDEYSSIMNMLGWYTVSSTHDARMSDTMSTSFGEEFMNIIIGLIERGIIARGKGASLTNDLRRMINTFKNPARSNETSGFEGVFLYAHRGLARNSFEVALVSETADGSSPVITFVAFEVNVALKSWDILWGLLRYRGESFTIKSARKSMVLNKGIYDNIKETLANRLVGKSEEFILNVPLD